MLVWRSLGLGGAGLESPGPRPPPHKRHTWTLFYVPNLELEPSKPGPGRLRSEWKMEGT